MFPMKKYKTNKKFILENCNLKQFFHFFLADSEKVIYQGKEY